MKKSPLILTLLIFMAVNARADISLPKVFSDNMILQRNGLIPVWGWALPGENISVSFKQQLKKTKADKSGKWMVKLDAEPAGGNFELVVTGKNTLRLKNILVGDVWLCSGQSNMEWTVGQSNNAKKEIETANYPAIRQIKINHAIGSLPVNDVQTEGWRVCEPGTVATFSGAAYFFAKNIYESTGVPVGLINDCWGGTNIETWISREGFEQSAEFKSMIAMMPRINLDSLGELQIKGTTDRIEKLQGAKPGSLPVEKLMTPGFDDSKWPELMEPQQWEQQSIGDLDGVVWLRKTINLTGHDLSKEAILELSKIDDDDITYVNGTKVGSTNQWDAFRKYSIAPGILHEGKNLIAVRVVDNTGGGGIYGQAEDMKLSIGQSIIPLSGQWKFQVESIKKSSNENSFPSLCYNGMISPIIPYAFKGVLWYQGESNAGRAFQYRKAFPLLINDWRQKWNNGNFPFYFVQLATYEDGGNSNKGSNWAELREAQTMTLQLPNTGMVVATDIGNPKDIHPTNKQDVGKRLAALALNNLYNKPMVCNGPAYQSTEINDNSLLLSFINTGSGLYTPDKYGYLKGFEIAGKDQVFYYAKAAIVNNKIVVSSDQVPNPVAVRFGWAADASDNNLFNKEGFPAVPFRTDDWKTITRNEKYKIEVLQ